jgi:surface protein
LDITASITSLGENNQGMFYQNSAFNQPIGTWNTSSIIKMRQVFFSAAVFDQDVSNWQVTQVTDLVGFMQNAKLSTANYDALLIAWDAQGAMSFSGTAHFGLSKYTAGGAAEAARTSLISKWGGIIDGGAA